ncbi:c-type cytochrome [Xanthomonadaceae bacterium JHOS43]|nr:c-type cytochrome [Xanthomonadaceae bacterium JHOS43]
MTAAVSLGLCLAFAVGAQDEGAPVQVSASPDMEPAQTTELTDAHGPAVAGDAAAGAGKAAACAACHGADGNSVDPQYPKLAGQSERYIARQLAMYKDGSRQDPVMLGFASILSPQDMRDVGAYFATLKALPGIADDSTTEDGSKFYQVGEKLYRGGDLERGIPACLACHGPSGRGNPGSMYPALAGQHAGYTARKLEAFRDGQAWGKDNNRNTVMVDVAATLTNAEIQSLASYIEGLHDAAEVAAQ